MSVCLPRTPTVSAQPLGRSGRSTRDLGGLLHRFDVGVEAQAPVAREEVVVAPVEAAAELRVGAVAQAELEPAPRSLDEAHAHRHLAAFGRRRVGVDLHAGEVPGADEAALVALELLAVVGLARREGPEARRALLVVARDAAHLQRAEAQGRAAVDRDGEGRRVGVRIDARLALRDPRAGVEALGDHVHRAPLRPLPRDLREHGAGRQEPVLANGLDQGIGARVVVGERTAEADVEVGDPRGLAGLDRDPDDLRLDGGVDGGLHCRREVAVGGDDVAGLDLRLGREAREQLGRHRLVALPAVEVESGAQRLRERERRVDVDAVLHVGIRRLGADRCGEREEQRDEEDRPARRKAMTRGRQVGRLGGGTDRARGSGARARVKVRVRILLGGVGRRRRRMRGRASAGRACGVAASRQSLAAGGPISLF